MKKILLVTLMMASVIACKKDDGENPSLDTPENFTTSTSFSDRIELDWEDVDAADEYSVFRAPGTLQDNPEDLNFQDVGGATDSFFEDTNVLPSSGYYYKVRAIGNNASSELSDAVYAETAADIIDPNNPDQVAGGLIINGTVRQGNPPAPAIGPTAPTVSGNQISASVSPDNTLFLPFNFETAPGTTSGYGGCYVQVNGASSFWDIPANDPTAQGQIVIPVGIPANFDFGTFCISYCIYDATGQVSNILQTCVTIEPPVSCPAFESGSDGLTIFTVELGDTAGVVNIQYDTYSVPDRIDVFYAGNWVNGTGSPLSNGAFPPVMDCNGTVADGYVGAFGNFTINHDPALASSVDVYVSGCIGGGTAWDVSVGCPE